MIVTRMSKYILATLTPEQREAVIGSVCAWCKHKIPLSYRTTMNGSISSHYIDGQTAACKAQELREAIYNEDRGVEREQEEDDLADIRERGT